MKVRIQGRQRRVSVVTGSEAVWAIPHLRPSDGRQALQYSPAQIAAYRKKRWNRLAKDRRIRRANQVAKMAWKVKA